MLDNFIGLVPDVRTSNYYLIDNTKDIFVIIVCYLMGVYYIFPNYMKSKEPYNLKGVIYFYNIFQVIINSWIIIEGIKGGWSLNYFNCMDVDRSNSKSAAKLAKTFYLIFLVKLLDLVETFFFLLRKKENQVSFLHVFHHICTLSISWLGSRYAPGGSHITVFILNSFIHCLMYSYYQLSALGYKKLDKWKRLLTTLQLIQFGIFITMSANQLRPGCQMLAKKEFAIIGFPVNLSFVYLFGQFYRGAYMKKKKAN